MRALVNVARFTCAVSCLADCGGGGIGPTSTVGVVLGSASPSPGSTLTLAPHSNGELSAPVSMTFTVVSDRDIPAPLGEVTWGACAISCGVSGLPLDTLKANQPQTLTVHRVSGQPPGCSFPATASVHVSIRELLFFKGASFSRDLPVSYTFVGGTPSGGGYPVCGKLEACVGEPGGGSTTGMCHDATGTCSADLSNACSSHGGLSCVLCPGPLCPGPLPPPEC
jgi:hypothetical protein